MRCAEKWVSLQSLPQKKASSGPEKFPQPVGPVKSNPEEWSYQFKAD